MKNIVDIDKKNWANLKYYKRFYSKDIKRNN